MIGIWKSSADVYLYIVGAVSLISFGIPLTFVPMRWARLFRWEVVNAGKLTVFMGRSLGVMLSILSIFAFKAARDHSASSFFFDLLLWIFGGMLLLHIYGAIRKAQPWTETVEIGLWVVLSLVTLGFYPV